MSLLHARTQLWKPTSLAWVRPARRLRCSAGRPRLSVQVVPYGLLNLLSPGGSLCSELHLRHLWPVLPFRSPGVLHPCWLRAVIPVRVVAVRFLCSCFLLHGCCSLLGLWSGLLLLPLLLRPVHDDVTSGCSSCCLSKQCMISGGGGRRLLLLLTILRWLIWLVARLLSVLQ